MKVLSEVEIQIEKLFEAFAEISMEAINAGLPEETLSDAPEAIKVVLDSLIKRKELIAEAAAIFEKTEMFIASQDKDVDEFMAEFNKVPAERRPVLAWEWMCDRIIQAPFNFMMEGAIVLLLPMVNKFLTEYLAAQNGNG